MSLYSAIVYPTYSFLTGWYCRAHQWGWTAWWGGLLILYFIITRIEVGRAASK